MSTTTLHAGGDATCVDPTGAAVDAALDRLTAVVDELLELPMAGLAGVDLVGLVTSLEAQRRRLDALAAQVLAAVQRAGAFHEAARASVVDLLVSGLHVDPGEARARAARAADLGPRSTLTGESLPPLLPTASAALRAGAVSAAHCSVIASAVEQVPTHLPAVFGDLVESTLVTASAHEHPRLLRRTARILLERIDPDGAEPRDEDDERLRSVSLGRRDGAGALRGRLTADTTAIWQVILDALSQPASGDDGEPDPRTAGQRRHDALHEAGLRLLRSGTLPDSGGVPTTVLVHTTAAELADANASHATGHGDLISTRVLGRILADAHVVPMTTGPGGTVLQHGRGIRLATPAQRRALAVRDGGCCFPGCTRPASWCQTHHVTPWARGGRTDLDNLALLCGYHHRRIDSNGWLLRMVDGLPEWTPPPWVDPAGRPRRNRAHHRHELRFGDAEGDNDVQALIDRLTSTGVSPPRRRPAP